MSQYRRVGVATQGKNLLSIVASLGRVEYLFLGGVHVPNLKEKNYIDPQQFQHYSLASTPFS